jgi:hypothetical protein
MHVLVHVIFAQVQSCISSLKVFLDQRSCDSTAVISTLKTLDMDLWHGLPLEAQQSTIDSYSFPTST